jgi:Protein of unknown function (DUF3011)
MNRLHAALAALALCSLAGISASEESGWMADPQPGVPGRSGTVTCESRNDSRRHCAVRNIDTESVYMQRQLSNTDCRRGHNWGVDSDGIWVDGGCRAVFEFVDRRGGGGSAASRPGTIRCESHDDRRKHCEVSNIDPNSVTMDRKLSNANCHRGQNWDADSRGIWVDRGCRAEFGYATRGGGHAGGGGASESSMRDACINRAAREWSVTTANLEITHAERLQNGGYRFNVQSKRTAGTCMVDRDGNVYRLFTQ